MFTLVMLCLLGRLQVLVRFAAGPVLLVLAVCALIIRKALLNFKYSMLWGLGG
jgi:hypothetical protein